MEGPALVFFLSSHTPSEGVPFTTRPFPHPVKLVPFIPRTRFVHTRFVGSSTLDQKSSRAEIWPDLAPPKSEPIVLLIRPKLGDAMLTFGSPRLV